MEFNAYLQELRAHTKHLWSRQLWLRHLWLTLGLGLSLSFAGLVSDCPPLHQVTLQNAVLQNGVNSHSVLMNGLVLEKELKAAKEDCLEFRLGANATPSLTSELIRYLPKLVRCGDSTIKVAVVEKGPGIVFRASINKPGQDGSQSFAAALTQSFPNIREIVVSNQSPAQNSNPHPDLPQNASLVTSKIKIILQDNQELEYDIITDKPVSLAKEMKVVEVKAHTRAATPAGVASAVEFAGHPVWASRGFRHYREVRELEATAYYPGPECTGQYAAYGLTYTGKKAGFGIAAVDPAVIPLGSKLYVVGYGFAAAEDIGGLIKGNKIDLCFETYQEAVNYGRQRVMVYILE